MVTKIWKIYKFCRIIFFFFLLNEILFEKCGMMIHIIFFSCMLEYFEKKKTKRGNCFILNLITQNCVRNVCVCSNANPTITRFRFYARQMEVWSIFES